MDVGVPNFQKPGLKPLVACHGVSVTTVEGVGSERKCVHQVQKRIAPWAEPGGLGDEVRKWLGELWRPMAVLSGNIDFL